MQVSVLKPVFNQERYVAEAIESILSQSYENFEFIIVDDGSTDNTFSLPPFSVPGAMRV
jgi:glycosyltransferase involved in cell wall biosynthesis